MKRGFFNTRRGQTPFVRLDVRKCKGCWKCLEACRNLVIGRINLPWHKHALIVEPGKCRGCLKCVEVCEYQAYSTTDTQTKGSKGI